MQEEIDDATGQPKNAGNAQRFIDAVQRLQLPSASQFSLEDLQSTGWEDRQRVSECLLTLKRYHEAEQKSGIPSSPFKPFQSPTKSTRDTQLASQSDMSRFSPLQLGSSFTSKHAATPDFDLVTQQYMGSASKGGLKQVAGKGKEAAAGVTRLMQQCTAMLRERMWSDGGNKLSPARGALPYNDNPMDAMGPVLESVLGSLTQVSPCRNQQDFSTATRQDLPFLCDACGRLVCLSLSGQTAWYQSNSSQQCMLTCTH